MLYWHNSLSIMEDSNFEKKVKTEYFFCIKASKLNMALINRVNMVHFSLFTCEVWCKADILSVTSLSFLGAQLRLGGGGRGQRFISYTQKNPNFRICLPNLTIPMF